jgi:hypothetical protein
VWTYRQSTGELRNARGDVMGHGYAGFGHGKNDPADEAVGGVGPIPDGFWLIGEPFDTGTHGPYVLRLVPLEADTHGRSGFLIHGDSKSHPGEASHGCIILARDVRELVWTSGDHRLHVVP